MYGKHAVLFRKFPTIAEGMHIRIFRIFHLYTAKISSPTNILTLNSLCFTEAYLMKDHLESGAPRSELVRVYQTPLLGIRFPPKGFPSAKQCLDSHRTSLFSGIQVVCKNWYLEHANSFQSARFNIVTQI